MIPASNGQSDRIFPFYVFILNLRVPGLHLLGMESPPRCSKCAIDFATLKQLEDHTYLCHEDFVFNFGEHGIYTVARQSDGKFYCHCSKSKKGFSHRRTMYFHRDCFLKKFLDERQQQREQIVQSEDATPVELVASGLVEAAPVQAPENDSKRPEVNLKC